MGKKFDPQGIRERLLGATGYAWTLGHRFEESQAIGALGNHAGSDLGVAIQCLLVGFEDPARRLLERAAEWVQIAVATRERPSRYFPGGTEAIWFETLALSNWLLSNRHDTESYRRFAEHQDRCLTNRSVARNKTEVSFALPSYVDAGMYERALQIFEATPGLAPPTASTIQGEARMSYVVSRHRLGLQYSSTEFEAMATKFLRRNIDAWLGDGHWSSAARWMKIIHWNGAEPPISAKEALLKCYDYLPGRERPGQASA
jgi:hypothetical protein